MYLIGALGTMIVTAAILVLVSKRIHVPAIVTYIVVGLISGPLLSYVVPFLTGSVRAGSEALPESIDLIAHVGIVLLLFIVGLELSLEKIREIGRVAVWAGLGQVVFTAVGGFGLSLLLGFNTLESIFLGVALTFSSTVVVVKLLDQKKELDSLYGRIAVGIFLVQDLVVIIVLTLLAGLGSPENISPAAVAGNLARAFSGMAVLLTLAIVASRYFLARPFDWAARSPDTVLIWSLAWCFLFVWLATLLGLSPELGAFLAGISLAQLKSSHDLRHRIHPLMNFFVAIFFISLGAQLELSSAGEHLVPAVVLSLFVLIGNPLIFIWIITRCGYDLRTSFLTSVTVAQISEFSFVFAALGMSSGLIGESILSLTAAVGLVTIGISAYLILYNQQLFDWIDRRGWWSPFEKVRTQAGPGAVGVRDHVVVVGQNMLGRQIARLLAEHNENIILIDRDPRKLLEVPGKRVLGSVEYHSVTEEAQLPQAKLAVSTLKIEDVNSLFAFRCKQLKVPVAIHSLDKDAIETLKTQSVDFVIDSKRVGAGALIGLVRGLAKEGL